MSVIRGGFRRAGATTGALVLALGLASGAPSALAQGSRSSSHAPGEGGAVTTRTILGWWRSGLSNAAIVARAHKGHWKMQPKDRAQLEKHAVDRSLIAALARSSKTSGRKGARDLREDDDAPASSASRSARGKKKDRSLARSSKSARGRPAPDEDDDELADNRPVRNDRASSRGDRAARGRSSGSGNAGGAFEGTHLTRKPIHPNDNEVYEQEIEDRQTTPAP